MPRLKLSRRDALKSAAVAALPLFSAACTRTAVAQTVQPKQAWPALGVATTGFTDYTNVQMAEAAAREGLQTVQLFFTQSDSNFWKYNGRNDLSSLSDARCKEIAKTYRDAGLSIHSMGVYTNLIHPKESERKANLAYFDDMMRIGGVMGVDTFITECGHYQSNEPEPKVPYHFQEPVWKQMVATCQELAAMAERHRATVLFEPFYRSFLATAKRTRVFLEEVGSPRMRVNLDPANLLESNDLEEMFDQLGPHTVCVHAKDRKLHVDRGVPAGQGDLDYPKFVKLSAERTPKAPLVVEYVGSKDFAPTMVHLRKVLTAVFGSRT